MVEESKEDLVLEEVFAPAAAAPPPSLAAVRAGPRIPKWGNPLAPEKGLVRVGPLPSDLLSRLETLTAVVPMGEPAAVVGAGAAAGAAGAPGKPKPGKPRAAPGLAPTALVERARGDRGAAVAVAAHAAEAAAADAGVAMPKPLAELGDRFAATDYSRVQIHPENAITGLRDVFVPSNRRYFKQFIIQSYWRYKLKDVPAIPDPDACAKALSASKKEVKTFAYQSFVRDYMQRPSPYRGVLVYHGLGSGKTCTSIAALEALYQEQQRPIIIMTPASLQPNYRDEITKCGPYIYRLQNHWTWIPVPSLTGAPTPEAVLLLRVVGLPRTSIVKRGGGWLPDPAKPANFDSLTAEQRKQIQDQIIEVMNARFQFINYNGVLTETVRGWACAEKNKFDGATIVIDEVHNLVRTINNANLEYFYKDEPRSMATFKPKSCAVADKVYNKSYLLYRMLCNAVGAKIIALSATPIINFPQEIAILANLLAGDGRMAEVETPMVDDAKQKAMMNVFKFSPEVDFSEIQARSDGSGLSMVRFTPVPSGFRKVVKPDTGDFRGFVRLAAAADAAEVKREADLESWFERVNGELAAKGIAALPDTTATFTSFTRLPDLEKPFREIFIDTDKLEVKESTKLLLMARLSGLISYYKGGKADLMATSKEYVVEVEMSDPQLKEYTAIRKEEIDREKRDKKLPKGAKKPNESMYDKATTSVNSTFKIFSRAACNFTFPGDMERPVPSDFRLARKLIGALPGASGDAVADEADRSALDPEGLLLEAPTVAEEAAEEGAAAAAEEGAGAAAGAAAAAAPPKRAKAAAYEEALTASIVEFKERGADLFREGNLAILSPKFQEIINRLKTSPGPVLVYSNFKTLEGVGLFGMALDAQIGARRLDIVQTGGRWTLSPETIAGGAEAPRYIAYTGDEDRDKRNILLAIFNAKWSKVPGALAAQIQEFTGSSDNKRGQIAKVFMITQSGAEGISLSNVRQVHIMEPYWNYVRLDQVKGRAIRICSHMDLPVEERHVDTYIYISKFSRTQVERKAVDETLLNFDEGKTTDQSIYELMLAKKKLADSLTDVMKRAAVDCELNATENGGYACYRFEGASMEPLFHPLLSVDIREGGAAVRAAAGAVDAAAADE